MSFIIRHHLSVLGIVQTRLDLLGKDRQQRLEAPLFLITRLHQKREAWKSKQTNINEDHKTGRRS